MKTIANVLLMLMVQLVSVSITYAYPIQVTRFEDEGALYIESDSIVKKGRFANLTYFENFSQAQSYGEKHYLSKATDIRVDCPNRRVFAIQEYYYTDPDRSGRLLGVFPLSDPFGSFAEHGSWVSQVVNIACKAR